MRPLAERQEQEADRGRRREEQKADRGSERDSQKADRDSARTGFLTGILAWPAGVRLCVCRAVLI